MFMLLSHYPAFQWHSQGVESRLATLKLDTDDLNKLSEITNLADLPSSFLPGNISQLVAAMPALFNMLNIRRAIIPAANGHCSARALARYYAALADGGIVPPPHSHLSKPPLGSHLHIPKCPSKEPSKMPKDKKSKELTAASKEKTNNNKQSPKYGNNLGRGNHDRNCSSDRYTRLINTENSGSNTSITDISNCVEEQSNNVRKIFSGPKIHDAFLGVGDYVNLVLPNGNFGLGFKRYNRKDGSFIGFGHSGMGGSTGLCDMKNRFAIAVTTLNKMSFDSTTGRIIHLVCSELNLPLPEEYLRFGEADMPVDLVRPIVN